MDLAAAGPPRASSLTVLDPGPLTTVQDRGRAGLAHLGVPRSGALDDVSAAAANRLVGNTADAAVLETTGGGCAVRFGRSAVAAVTGAVCDVDVDGRARPHGLAVAVRAGAVLRVGPALAGVRSYLAVGGGIDVPAVLGSRSTDLLSGLGPPPLRAGAEVGLGPSTGQHPAGSDVAVVARLPGPAGVAVGVHPGPRADWFTPAARSLLLDASWSTTTRSNRTGIGLDGPGLDRVSAGELPSEGLVLGAVQVPPAGSPVIFLADHPTTGGYPVIAVVAAADLALLAQTPPGTRLRFTVAGAVGYSVAGAVGGAVGGAA